MVNHKPYSTQPWLAIFNDVRLHINSASAAVFPCPSFSQKPKGLLNALEWCRITTNQQPERKFCLPDRYSKPYEMALEVDNPCKRITRSNTRKEQNESGSTPNSSSGGMTSQISPPPAFIQLFATNVPQRESLSKASAEQPAAQVKPQTGRKHTSPVRSSKKSPIASAIKMQLWHADSNTFVDDFEIRTKDSKESNRNRILAQLDITYAFLFTEDAKCEEPNLRSVTDGQTIIVYSSGLSLQERRLPPAPLHYKRYCGEEILDVDPQEGQRLWAKFTEVKRRDHIGSLARRDPKTRNCLRITEGYSDTKKRVDAVREATAMQLETNYTPRASKEKIYIHWGVHFTMLFPDSLKPPVDDVKMLALLTILAQATPGQSRIVKKILVDLEEKDGRSRVLKEGWVLKAIELIYREAGLFYGDSLCSTTPILKGLS
jgi:hypothetical protein